MQKTVPWQAPVGLIVGIVIGFPYFISNPPGLNDGWPPLTGLLVATAFFTSGYYAGRGRRS